MYEYHILFILCILNTINADTYKVKIETDTHINLIDDKFLSFTVDPKYLFSGSEKYRSKECLCMASSLSPAYIRIAGPSTSQLTFRNATISIDEAGEVGPVSFQDHFAGQLAEEFRGRLESRFKRNHDKIEVSHKDWRKFVQWASSTGFELVFALNNDEKTSSGLWDPNTALDILTVAEKGGVGDIYWQLGYECKNQSIEEYLTDLETLRVITETFPAGARGQWRVVGGDVTPCLHEDSKSDFKDYVMLSDDMMDAILLNGNSSTAELSRMSPRDRTKLLKVLSTSTTPLWLTEPRAMPIQHQALEKQSSGIERQSKGMHGQNSAHDELLAAVEWLSELGQAARNGFSAHFRELGEDMYRPTLSFYMALLFKNLVGSKVLSLDMDAEQTVLYAHCTVLQHQAVPGAVTIYGANLEGEVARVGVGLGGVEEGGEVLQFVLGQDSSGNILVNGRPMYVEGDLKPVVKRVRPYKTLVINIPPKSFGFWVLANTKVRACFQDNQESIETLSESVETENIKKRSIKEDKERNDFEETVNLADHEDNKVTDKNIISKINDLNENLDNVQNLFKIKLDDHKITKRQTIKEKIGEIRKKIRRHSFALRNNKKFDSEERPKGISKLFRVNRRNLTSSKNGSRKPRFSKNKVSKRNPQTKDEEMKIKPRKVEKPKQKALEKSDKELVRTRRSVNDNKIKVNPESSLENEVVDAPADKAKLWKILKSIHKELKDLSDENEEYIEETDSKQDSNEEGIIDSQTGFIKSTVGNLMRVLSDLNKNLHRFWDAINLLD